MNRKSVAFLIFYIILYVPAVACRLSHTTKKDNYEDKIPCIICIGQSNADGRVPLDSLPDNIKLPLTRCMVSFRTSDGNFVPLTKQNFLVGNKSCFAFDLIVYNQLCNVEKQTLYVIKHTLGGTSIDKEGRSNFHWTADYNDLDSLEQSLFYKFESQFKACKRKYGKQLDVRAVLWHQGEGDAVNDVVAARYYENLKKLVASVRKLCRNKKLPFITGTISHQSSQYNVLIENAQKQLAEEDSHFYLVDMSKGTLLDPYHFDAKSTVYLGESVYNLLIESGAFKTKKIMME